MSQSEGRNEGNSVSPDVGSSGSASLEVDPPGTVSPDTDSPDPSGAASVLLTSGQKNANILTVFASAALVGLFVYLMVIAEAILLPLAIAVFLVLLLDAFATRLNGIQISGRRVPPWFGMALGILLMLLALVALGNLVKSNITAVSAAVPTYAENINALLNRAVNAFGLEELPSIRDLVDQINIAQMLGGTVSALASVTGNTMTVLFYIVFILLEQVTFNRKIEAFFTSSEDHRRAREMIGKISRDIQTYIGLKTFVSAITGILSYGVMAVLGVDFAAFWAVLIFILNFIPYIGSLVGVAFPASLTLVQFDGFGPFMIIALVLTSVQLIVGNVIEPRLMGRSLNLSPLVILLSLAVFGQIWGVAGMVLSMPLMVIVMIVCAGFKTTRPVAILLSATGRIDKESSRMRDLHS